MKIASLVIRVQAEHIDALGAALLKIPGVEVHAADADLGRMAVTVEDGDGYAMTDSLLAVNLASHVLAVTLAYEYTDEGLPIDDGHPEPMPGLRPAGLQTVMGGAQNKEA